MASGSPYGKNRKKMKKWLREYKAFVQQSLNGF
jgi:hypothetical protein